MTQLPEPNFIDRDPDTITKEWIEKFEEKSGKVLQPAQIERLIININTYHTLPTELILPDGIEKTDFTLAFEVTQGEGEVDGEGVFTAHTDASEIPDVVTVTLTYDGKTYTDTLDIYVTELEVKSE